MKKPQLKKLTPYARNFRSLSMKNISTKKRRAELMKAGFLPAILGVLASMLVPKILKGVLK